MSDLPDPWTPAGCRAAARLFAAGNTWEQIAEVMGLPHPVHARHLVNQAKADDRVARELIRLAGGGSVLPGPGSAPLPDDMR